MGYGGAAFHNVGVVGFDGVSKAQTGFAVFVSAVNERFLRQRCDPAERGVKLPGRALEEAPTATREESVATEQGIFAIIGNMPTRVPSHVEHPHFEIQPWQADLRIGTQAVGGKGDIFYGRRKNGHIVFGNKFGNAPGVVGMVVRDQYGAEAMPAVIDVVEHGFGVAWIDNDELIVSLKAPDVIVFERGQRKDGQVVHGGRF